MKKIAVIGAGTMGSDVAFDFASKGYKVLLKDINQEILEKAKNKILSDYRFIKMMKPKLSMSSDEILSNIHFTLQYDHCGDADVIVENVPENFEVKKKVYQEIQSYCKNDAKYFVNTSCISITEIAALLPHPENAIGVHFMNPVPLKEMVEVIKGYHTSEETISYCKEILKSLDKSPVVVNDMPGFVANRLSHLFMNEAAYLVQDQVAEPKHIDQIFKKGYGHKSGPLETADLIGLDTVVNSLEILYHSYQDPKFRCCPLLKKMVAAGSLGRKSGRGFYNY